MNDPMAIALVGFVGVLVGGLVTGITTLGVEWLKARNESRLDSDKRANDRWIERQRSQRETLLRLQEVANEASYANYIYFETSWLRSRTVDEATLLHVEAESRRLINDVALLRSRVEDEGLRSLAGRLIVQMGSVHGASTKDDAEERVGEVAGLTRQVLDQAGDLLRPTLDLRPSDQ